LPQTKDQASVFLPVTAASPPALQNSLGTARRLGASPPEGAA